MASRSRRRDRSSRSRRPCSHRHGACLALVPLRSTVSRTPTPRCAGARRRGRRHLRGPARPASCSAVGRPVLRLLPDLAVRELRSSTAADDVETGALLLMVGVAVTEIALWGRRQHALAGQSAGYLAGLHDASETAAIGDVPPSVLIERVCGQLIKVLGLRGCRFDYGTGLGYPRLRHDGRVTQGRTGIDVDAIGSAYRPGDRAARRVRGQLPRALPAVGSAAVPADPRAASRRRLTRRPGRGAALTEFSLRVSPPGLEPDASRLEAVAHPRLGDQVPRTGRVGLELAAQPSKVLPQVVELVGVRRAPDFGQQLPLADQLPGVPDQDLQDVPLGRRQPDIVTNVTLGRSASSSVARERGGVTRRPPRSQVDRVLADPYGRRVLVARLRRLTARAGPAARRPRTAWSRSRRRRHPAPRPCRSYRRAPTAR